MCDLGRVSGFVIAAQVAFLVVVGLLIAGIIASGSFFAAAGNIALMIAAIAAAGLGVGFLIAARAELGSCDFGPCNSSLESVKTALNIMIGTFSAVLALLIGLAVVAAIPFAGAAALGAVLAILVTVMIDLTMLAEFAIVDGITKFNACQEAANAAARIERTAVFVLAVFTAAVVVIATAAGFISGAIPHNFAFG